MHMKPDTKNTWMDNQLGALEPVPLVMTETKKQDAPKLQGVTFALMRVVFAFLFACHGAQKLFGLLGGQAQLHNPWMVTAGVIELVGATFIAFGLFTRPVAFLLCGEMAVAYFMGHFPAGFLPIQNHGELAVVFCFYFLHLTVCGAGPLSIDGLWKKV
jgi:putative oxidoreductase